MVDILRILNYIVIATIATLLLKLYEKV